MDPQLPAFSAGAGLLSAGGGQNAGSGEEYRLLWGNNPPTSRYVSNKHKLFGQAESTK